MEDFWEEWSDEVNVFFLVREMLNPENDHLPRTGLIVMMQGASTLDLLREIARYFAGRFGWR